MVRVWGVKETLVERNTEVFQAVRRLPAVPLAGEKDEASRRRRHHHKLENTQRW
jgi:hypothetical protein